eukprot:COSAG02_NODE_4067_length_5836_cov_18.100924_2_plen_65_part_00
MCSRMMASLGGGSHFSFTVSRLMQSANNTYRYRVSRRIVLVLGTDPSEDDISSCEFHVPVNVMG